MHEQTWYKAPNQDNQHFPPSYDRTHTYWIYSARSLGLGLEHIRHPKNCFCVYLCVYAYMCLGELLIYQVLSNVRVLSASG